MTTINGQPSTINNQQSTPDLRALNERIARTRSLINSLKRAESQMCDRRRLSLCGIESQIDALVDKATDSQLDRMMEDLEKVGTGSSFIPHPSSFPQEDPERWDGMG